MSLLGFSVARPRPPSYSRLCFANSITSCYGVNPFHLLVYLALGLSPPLFLLVVDPSLSLPDKFLSISTLCVPVDDRTCYASYITSVFWDICSEQISACTTRIPNIESEYKNVFVE